MADDFTKESEGKVGTIFTEEDARRAHHLATADPEPERGDGLLTGPAHEAKYGLERAEASAAHWRSHGVHPTENRALRPDEDGGENLRGRAAESESGRVERADSAPSGYETTSAPSA